MEGAVCVAPLISGNRWSSAGVGTEVSCDQRFAPMPTVQAKEAERSRIETFLARESMEARVERIVRMALLSEGLIVRTRKVAELVRGAERFWDSMGPRVDIVARGGCMGFWEGRAASNQLETRVVLVG